MNTDSSSSRERPPTALNKLMDDLRQLKLLLWKNFLISKRSKLGTLMEIIVPTIFVMILLPIRTIVKSEYFPNDTYFREFDFNKLPDNLTPQPPFGLRNKASSNTKTAAHQWKFAYQPNSSELANRIMLKVGSNLGMDIVG